MTISDISSPVPRIELMELLDRLSAKRLIYIHAPAGFGKTFSIRSWLGRRGGAAAWVSANEAMSNRPVDFCRRCAAGLLTLQPDNPALREISAHESFDAAPFEFIERAFLAFHVSEQNEKQPYTYVIDDLHLIENPNILRFLSEQALRLPENMTLCLISRTAPPDSFAEHVVKDFMGIVDVEFLKFSEEEIKALFSARGRSLTLPQAREIKESTGGWAIGLNALLLSDGEQARNWLPSSYWETFIREQLWDRWDEKRRSFMLRVSIMDELTPDFCNAIVGRSDSAETLSALVRENVFISVDNENVYRFHHLFRDFLRLTLESEPKRLRDELYKKSGDWFFKRADYYRAVECYIKCDNRSGVAKSLRPMYNYNSPYASVEETIAIIHMSVDSRTVDAYPFLLEPLAWVAFLEGRGSDMEEYIDRYFKKLPRVILQNPPSLQVSALLRCMDYRNSMDKLTAHFRKIPFKALLSSTTPSITQNMPFFHRSARDFASEYALLGEDSFSKLKKTVGRFFGDEYDTLEVLIRSGIAYERGDMDAAHKFAIEANAAVLENFAPELKFCALMQLAAILHAQGQESDLQKVLDSISSMIEHHKAYYLDMNYRAFLCRLKLNNGDKEAARNWLRSHAASPYDRLAFYKLYQHFTSTRAYIAVGDYTTAIVFLKKLLLLCEQYRRPLDAIEVNILLAIAYWKKGRGSQDEALISLETALLSAHNYGFTHVFANEGSEIINMLHKLLKRSVQKDYTCGVSTVQLRTLHIQALAQAKRAKGLTGGSLHNDVQFTQRQKEVMRYLCEGLTQKEIGAKLGLKPSTIKSHMILIYNKLDVTNAIDAVLKINELKVLN